MNQINQKVALVTGSSRGIGRDIALRLAETEMETETGSVAAVAVHYHKSKKEAEDVVKEIKRKGKKSSIFAADLMKRSETNGLIKEVEGKFGSIDILINNYGPILVKPWEKVTTSEWENIFRSNLWSALNCMKAVLPGMKQRKWGRIINIGYSRVEQLVAFSTITPYAMAKTSLLILTRSIAASVSPLGITVNMVSPGLMEGGILPLGKQKEKEKLGKFQDVSESVLFLVSEKAHFITGANLIVAGGWKV